MKLSRAVKWALDRKPRKLEPEDVKELELFHMTEEYAKRHNLTMEETQKYFTFTRNNK